MKISIGTVQFGMPYGINNILGIPSDLEIEKIFSLATKFGISSLDTAPGYGKSEEKIGNSLNKNFKIVTKFSKTKFQLDLINEFEKSLQNLKQDKVYGYLAHDPDNLSEFPKLWTTLISLKEQGKVEKIGYSLYSTDQLDNLLKLKMVPDLVQIPFSVLDKKFKPYLSKLKDTGTEIHVRSVFLQGLYFMDFNKLPIKLRPLRPELMELEDNCQKSNISIGCLALNFVVQNPLIDKVIIGVDSEAQLNQNIQSINNWKTNYKLMELVSQITVKNTDLLNPVNW